MSTNYEIEREKHSSPSFDLNYGYYLEYTKTCLVESVKGVWYLFYTFFGFSSLHGFSHITKSGRNLFERFWWVAMCAGALSGAITISLRTWNRFQSNPTVVSMERNWKDWNTTFPSIAICPDTKYTDDTLKKVMYEYEKMKDKSKMRKLLQELSKATYGSFDKVTVEISPDNFNPAEYTGALNKAAFPFVYKVSNSNPENYNVFRLNSFMSEIGICYSYNSDATYYNDPEYWEKDSWSHLGKFPVFQSNPLDGDIFAQVWKMNSGYQLFVYGPSEFPDVAMPRLGADNFTYKTLDLTALSIVSTSATKALGIPQRKCRQQHESDLDISPIYSYNLCRQNCRRKVSYKLCKCVPFFYRPTTRKNKYPVCDIRGMHCLQEHTDLLTKLFDPDTGRKMECKCYPLCDEVNYFIDADNTIVWSLGTNLKIGLIKYPKMRLKRDVIFGSSDLLVSIGGTAGLFLGCSILSIAEALYFFLLRPAYYFMYKLPLPYAVK